ncbi:MAG TPA: membrane protein insertase YidC [Gammaproteobacteria bacterium]|nr:membrane protein insertase YidC [Gammaproteobacteria bacterium]
MTVWTSWVDLLTRALELLSTQAGLGAGLAVVALTLTVRTLVLPITFPNACRGLVRQRTLAAMQPELARLKERYARDPQKYGEAMLAAYKRNGLSMVDGRSLLGALVQTPVLLGMFTALKRALPHGRFLWVADLAKPDVLLAIVAGLTTAILALAAPEMPEHVRMLMMILPAVCLAFTALHFGSAIALYWTTSNLFTAGQTLAVRWVVARHAASGAPSA